MPDWTYHSIFKPILFRMPPHAARDFTLQSMGMIAKLPFGPNIIDMMGDLSPLPSEGINVLGKQWTGHTGVGAGLAFDYGSVLALSQFGVAYVEVGPVTVSPAMARQSDLQRVEAKQEIQYSALPENPGLQFIAKEMEKASRKIRTGPNLPCSPVRLGARIANQPGEASSTLPLLEFHELAAKLAPSVDFLTIDSRWWQFDWDEDALEKIVNTVQAEALKHNPNILVFLAASPDLNEEDSAVLGAFAAAGKISGIMVTGGVRGSTPVTADGVDWSPWICGTSTKEKSIALVKRLKSLAPDVVLIGSGGILEPQDALDYIDAGATFVNLHSGLVYAGPCLAKRINECIAFRTGEAKPDQFNVLDGWVGFALVAFGLWFSAALVIYVGLTTTLLPYDEAFLGLTKGGLSSINENLLKFMSHDRVTLGGTSMSGSILFMFLALCGIRYRRRWAYRAEKIGLTLGFFAFFLYLGFKYFDPLHALVTVLVLPFFLWGVIRKPHFAAERSPGFHNDKAWLHSQFGQFLFVAIGAGLLLAGITIACVGCTNIFVHEDLMFMNTERCVLADANPHLLPLIAHDRASFGGCLWAVGSIELLTSLWGYRRGASWVWWALCLGGLPGFIAVLGIHFYIGYTHFIHLLPAYIAAVMYLVGLFLSKNFLFDKVPTKPSVAK